MSGLVAYSTGLFALTPPTGLALRSLVDIVLCHCIAERTIERDSGNSWSEQLDILITELHEWLSGLFDWLIRFDSSHGTCAALPRRHRALPLHSREDDRERQWELME